MIKIDNSEINKTSGPDRIVPQVFKELKCQICTPISIIFDKSLSFGMGPRG